MQSIFVAACSPIRWSHVRTVWVKAALMRVRIRRVWLLQMLIESERRGDQSLRKRKESTANWTGGQLSSRIERPASARERSELKKLERAEPVLPQLVPGKKPS